MKETLKKIAKGAMALMAIALATLIVTHVATVLYDVRLLVAAAGGAFAYRPLVDLASKIKGLE